MFKFKKLCGFLHFARKLFNHNLALLCRHSLTAVIKVIPACNFNNIADVLFNRFRRYRIPSVYNNQKLQSRSAGSCICC